MENNYKGTLTISQEIYAKPKKLPQFRLNIFLQLQIPC